MRIFISWSGDYARAVALSLKAWMPNVVQSLEVFVSAEDIEAGERWQSKINASLMEINFGVLLLTKENFERPWIMYEAGALAKNLGTAKVVPVFCGEKFDLSKTPLFQFNHVQLAESGIRSLMESVRAAAGDGALKPDALEASFKVWWPHLQAAIGQIEKPAHEAPPRALSIEERIGRMEEVLADLAGVVRTQAKVDGMTTEDSLLETLKATTRGFEDYFVVALSESENIEFLNRAMEILERISNQRAKEHLRAVAQNRLNELAKRGGAN